MWKRWLGYLILLGATFLFRVFYPAYLSHFVLILMLAVPALSLLVSLPALLGLRLELGGAATGFRGETVALTVCLRCPRGLPAFGIRYRWRCRNLLASSEMGSLQSVVAPEVGATMAWPVPLTHCGIYECEILRAFAYDALGLFALPIRIAKPHRILAQPKPALATLSLELPDPREAEPLPEQRGDCPEEYSVRAYRPGDPLHAIHWKLTSKWDELMVREAEGAQDGRVDLLFDFHGAIAALDGVLERLLAESDELLRQQRAHRIRWFDPDHGGLCAALITGPEDQQRFLWTIGERPLPPAGLTMPEYLRRLGDREAGIRLYVVPGKERAGGGDRG